jgi:sepiapterin reductase
MYHKVLAQELKKSPPTGREVRVLNYAPGPLDTDMQKAIREMPEVDPETQRFFIEMKEKNQLVDCLVSADKLFSILYTSSWENGAHVDFFDEI